MKKLKNKGIIFANTLWFIHNFKMPLIEELKQQNFDIEIIYLRLGPPINIKNKNLTKDIEIYNFYEYLFLSFKKYLQKKNIGKSFLFSFTIGPIFLSLIPIFNKSEKFATLEGLGRIFSSRKIFYRFLKRIVQIIYKIIFHKFYKGIFVLNYSDYAYLLEKNIVEISKLHIIPGTGINSSIFNPDNLYKRRLELNLFEKGRNNSLKIDELFVSYIGRISIEKGFYRFLAAITYLLNDKKYSSLKFQIVAPKNDISKIDKDLKNFFFNKKVVLNEYVENPLDYYANSKIIILPTTYGEGLSRVALEAGMLGVPVVAVQNRGLSSLFMDGILGETTSDLEPYGISRLIMQIINNYKKYSYLPKSVFENLASKYDNKVSANSVVDVLSSYIY